MRREPNTMTPTENEVKISIDRYTQIISDISSTKTILSELVDKIDDQKDMMKELFDDLPCKEHGLVTAKNTKRLDDLERETKWISQSKVVAMMILLFLFVSGVVVTASVESYFNNKIEKVQEDKK